MGSFFSNIIFERNGRNENQLNKIIADALMKARINIADNPCFFENSPDKKWVTIYCEKFIDMTITEKQMKLIAKKLDSFAINIYCVDSDFIDMKASDGRRVDTVYIGEPYFGNVGDPTLKAWRSFLNNDSDLNKFKEIISGDYVFVEESLEPLSELLMFNKDDVDCFFEEITERSVSKINI